MCLIYIYILISCTAEQQRWLETSYKQTHTHVSLSVCKVQTIKCWLVTQKLKITAFYDLLALWDALLCFISFASVSNCKLINCSANWKQRMFVFKVKVVFPLEPTSLKWCNFYFEGARSPFPVCMVFFCSFNRQTTDRQVSFFHANYWWPW